MSGVQVAALRLSVCGLVFTPVVWRFLKKVKREDIKYVFLAGLIGNGIPAFLFAIGQQRVDSSVAGILNALTPMFTIIIGYSTGVVLLNWSKVSGVILGLVGALAIILGKEGVSLTFSIGHLLMIVFATILYGANINLIRSKLAHYNPVIISALPLFFMSIPGLIIFLSSDLSFLHTTPKEQLIPSMRSVVILALLGNSFSLIFFNRLIQLSGPVFASSVTYIVPIIALLWGFSDNETVSTFQIAGLFFILTGIYLINRKAPKAVPTDPSDS